MSLYSIVFDNLALHRISENEQKAAIKTAYSIRRSVAYDKTVPFRTGALNQSFFVDDSNIQTEGVKIMYTVPYAAFQYFVPQNHYLGQHPNATDHWLDDYLPGGAEEDYAAKKYKEHLKKLMQGGNP